MSVYLLGRQCACCSVSVKCYLFKTYCSTLYWAPMWIACTKKQFGKKIKLAYHSLSVKHNYEWDAVWTV